MVLVMWESCHWLRPDWDYYWQFNSWKIQNTQRPCRPQSPYFTLLQDCLDPSLFLDPSLHLPHPILQFLLLSSTSCYSSVALLSFGLLSSSLSRLIWILSSSSSCSLSSALPWSALQLTSFTPSRFWYQRTQIQSAMCRQRECCTQIYRQ